MRFVDMMASVEGLDDRVNETPLLFTATERSKGTDDGN